MTYRENVPLTKSGMDFLLRLLVLLVVLYLCFLGAHVWQHGTNSLLESDFVEFSKLYWEVALPAVFVAFLIMFGVEVFRRR